MNLISNSFISVIRKCLIDLKDLHLYLQFVNKDVTFPQNGLRLELILTQGLDT